MDLGSKVLSKFLHKNINVGLNYDPKEILNVSGTLTGVDEQFLVLNDEMVYNLNFVVYVSHTE